MTIDEQKELLYRCKRIRAVEEAIAEHYKEQEMRCPTHLSIGQELVGASVGMVLNKSDLAISTHRAHAHYLGKNGDLKAMIAELYGRETGCSKGRGGSMHLIDRSIGFEGSTAIVGNSIPVGVGLALSIQLDGDGKRVACVFIGDAVFETGVFYESVNFAAVRSLPVLFVCENNLYSVYSPLTVRQPKNRNFCEIMEKMGINGAYSDGKNAIQIHEKIKHISCWVRSHRRPGFIEVSTYRWREHCGPNYDNDLGYREKKEYEFWRSNDAVESLEKRLLKEAIVSIEKIKLMEDKIALEIKEAFEFAQSSPFPEAENTGDYEYAPKEILL